MARKPRNKAEGKEKQDLRYPLEPIENDPEDCFGNEWDPMTKECSICAVSDLCGTLVGQTTTKKKKKDEERPYLDEVDTSSVDWDKLERIVEKHEKEGEPLTLKEMGQYLRKKVKTKDKELLKALVRSFVEHRPRVRMEDKKFRYDV